MQFYVFVATADNIAASAPGDFQIQVDWDTPESLFPDGTNTGSMDRNPGTGDWSVLALGYSILKPTVYILHT